MRVAVIVPRYGSEIVGGAETLARGFAEHVALRNWDVEVWTTCAQSHYTWENVLPSGLTEENGLKIRRFPAILQNQKDQIRLETRLASHGNLSVAEQYRWLECGVHSPDLYNHVAAYASTFDVVIALPYTVPLIHYAAWLIPGKTILWPCLHDEPYAYMEPVRLLMENVWGVAFNTPEEGYLATHFLKMDLPRQAVLGAGVRSLSNTVETTPLASHNLLYIGRLEEGKNLSLLYNFVQKYADEGGDIKLVVIGTGPLIPPAHSAFDYRGFVSEEEKAKACTSALAVCQPSLNESFSITIMEAWLAGRPVLVHQDCPVTYGHVNRSHGGLWFSSYDEFVAAVTWLQNTPRKAAKMGQNGKEYVQRNYTWDAVVSRFEHAVMAWKQTPQNPMESGKNGKINT